jgi:hypothetical protein
MEDRLPNDLTPLPTAPYSERPVGLPLDVEECRTAIWLARGNITTAASILKTTSLRLRNFVNKSPYLTSEMQEAKDQLVDIAENVVYDALTDEDDAGRRDTMARFVLGSQGKQRGWGSASAGGGINIKNHGGGTIIVQWADGQAFGDNDDSATRAENAIDITPEQSGNDSGEAA